MTEPKETKSQVTDRFSVLTTNFPRETTMTPNSLVFIKENRLKQFLSEIIIVHNFHDF